MATPPQDDCTRPTAVNVAPKFVDKYMASFVATATMRSPAALTATADQARARTSRMLHVVPASTLTHGCALFATATITLPLLLIATPDHTRLPMEGIAGHVTRPSVERYTPPLDTEASTRDAFELVHTEDHVRPPVVMRSVKVT